MDSNFKPFNLSQFTTVARPRRRCMRSATPLLTLDAHHRTYGKDNKEVSGALTLNAALVKLIDSDFVYFATQGTTMAIIPTQEGDPNAYRIRNAKHEATTRTVSLAPELRSVLLQMGSLDISTKKYRFRFEKYFDGQNTFFVTNLNNPYSAMNLVREGK